MVLVDMPFTPSSGLPVESRAKIRSVRSWIRLLTFQSDYRYIASKLLERLRRPGDADDSEGEPSPATMRVQVDDDGFNAGLVAAFRRVLESDANVLLMLCESSAVCKEFDFCEEKITGRSPDEREFDVARIELSNHTFFLQESQQRLLSLLLDWFSKQATLRALRAA